MTTRCRASHTSCGATTSGPRRRCTSSCNGSGHPTPTYHHHDLIRDEAGRRLAKIDGSRALSAYRDAGLSPADVMALIGWDASASAPSRTAV